MESIPQPKTFSQGKSSSAPLVEIRRNSSAPGPSAASCPDPPALIEALALERLGFSVIPLWPGSKVAAVRWKRWQRERPSPGLLRRWWRQNPAFGVGVVTGAVSGVVSLDVDGPAGQAALQGRHLPPTAILETPRGHQRFFRLTAGVSLPRHVGLLPQVDLLGEGSYSAILNGDGRAWAFGLSPEEAGLAEVPAWMIALSQGQDRPALASPGDSRPLHELLPPLTPGQLPSGVAQGARINTACRFAGSLIARGLSEQEVLRWLWNWDTANSPSMRGDRKEERKVRDMVRRLLAKEQAKPPGARGLRIPRELLKRDLGDGPILLAAHLLAYAQEGRQTPSWRDMGQALDADPATVWRWRRALAQVGVSETDLEALPTQRYFTIPRGLLFDTGLSRGARVTALRLASFMDAGTARVALEVLAQVRGLSSRQVQRHLREVETAGHLETIREVYDQALGTRPLPNLYRFAEVSNVAPVSCPSEAVYLGSMTESVWDTPAVAARATQ